MQTRIYLKVVSALTRKSIDIISIREINSGASDSTVLKTAEAQNRILITFDADFGELIFRQKLKAKGVILLKLVPKSSQHIAETIENILGTQAKIEGHFLIVRENKIRVLTLKE